MAGGVKGGGEGGDGRQGNGKGDKKVMGKEYKEIWAQGKKEIGGGVGGMGNWESGNVKGMPETLYHRDDALLYIAYVMLIWAAPIPADRWHCSLWP